LAIFLFPHPSSRIFGSASITMPEPLEIEQRTYEARQQEFLYQRPRAGEHQLFISYPSVNYRLRS
jgi:hypothetical protein